MNDAIKKELHQLIDKCNNELLLEEAKVILTTEDPTKTNLQSEEEKNIMMEPDAQYRKGVFINHEELKGLYEQWITGKDITPAQKLALDKELDAIQNNPDYLLKWNEIKSRFKRP